MLSIQERNYLENKTNSKNYEYVLRYRIRYKINQLMEDLPLLQRLGIMEFNNDNLKNKELRTGSEPVTFTLPM